MDITRRFGRRIVGSSPAGSITNEKPKSFGLINTLVIQKNLHHDFLTKNLTQYYVCDTLPMVDPAIIPFKPN